MEEKKVLVIRTSDAAPKALRDVRDYVMESIRLGILVLNCGWDVSVEDLPDSSEIIVSGDGPPAAGLPPEAELLRAHDIPKYSGRGGEEKREIMARLRAYRETNGPGCLEAVASLCGARIDSGILRDIVIGGISLPLEDWRRVGRALDRLDKKEAANG